MTELQSAAAVVDGAGAEPMAAAPFHGAAPATSAVTLAWDGTIAFLKQRVG